MTRFRKLPVEVEAFQLEHGGDVESWPEWARQAAALDWHRVGSIFPVIGDPSFYIRTLEGTLMARPGDWIVQGVAGEIYPVKPDIFAATFEALA